MNLINFFSRKSNDFEYAFCKQEYDKKLSYEEIFKGRSNRVKKMFAVKNQDHFLRYRFEILRRFIYEKQRYTKSFISQLDIILETLKLNDELNSYETEFVNHCNAVVFAKRRNLKNSIIEFPLISKSEKIFYKYDNVYFSLSDKITSMDLKINFQKVEFFLTTKRVVVQQTMELFSIDYEKIIDFKVANEGFIIYTDKNKFLFSAYDPYVLYVSFERMLKFLGIKK